MQRILGGLPLTHNGLLRELLLSQADAGAKAAGEAEAAAEDLTEIHSMRPLRLLLRSRCCSWPVIRGGTTDIAAQICRISLGQKWGREKLNHDQRSFAAVEAQFQNFALALTQN